LAVTDWRLRRWRLWFLALMTATRKINKCHPEPKNFLYISNMSHYFQLSLFKSIFGFKVKSF